MTEVLGTEIFDNGWTDCGDIAHPWGIGMPAFLKLEEFGRVVHEAFGVYPFLVGSALREKVIPRDIDVRLVLPQSIYGPLIGPAGECGKPFTRWAALSRAFSALGQEMTGLPIDFQIETTAVANVYRGSMRRLIGKDPNRRRTPLVPTVQLTDEEREEQLDQLAPSPR